jgi:hypothetical protein
MLSAYAAEFLSKPMASRHETVSSEDQTSALQEALPDGGVWRAVKATATGRGAKRLRGARYEEPGCGKSALGSTARFSSHGGGARCEEPGCGKAARGSTARCIAHGGDARCEELGCGKSAVGSTARCAAHGGGARCE